MNAYLLALSALIITGGSLSAGSVLISLGLAALTYALVEAGGGGLATPR
jgi:hypothetical protein